TFLVWLKRYAPVAGRQPVPKLEELYDKWLALVGFWFWFAGLVLGWVVTLADLPTLPLVGLVLIAGATCFVITVISIARHWTKGRWRGIGDLVVGRVLSAR